MAIYSFNVSNVSRKTGASSCATLAYITGNIVTDERTGKTYKYGHQDRIVAIGTFLPEAANEKYRNPARMMNEIERVEKNENARPAKKIIVALPRELTSGEREDVLIDFVENEILTKNYGCVVAIHDDPEDKNPHAHILIPNRQFSKSGDFENIKRKMEYALDENGNRIPLLDENGNQKLGARNRKQWKRVCVDQNPLDKKEVLEAFREGWERSCNKYLDQSHQIDHRSYKDRNMILPTIHEGYAAREIEKKGDISNRCEYNRAVKRDRARLFEDKKEIQNIKRELSEKERVLAALEKEAKEQANVPKITVEHIIRMKSVEPTRAVDQRPSMSRPVEPKPEKQPVEPAHVAMRPMPETVPTKPEEKEQRQQQREAAPLAVEKVAKAAEEKQVQPAQPKKEEIRPVPVPEVKPKEPTRAVDQQPLMSQTVEPKPERQPVEPAHVAMRPMPEAATAKPEEKEQQQQREAAPSPEEIAAKKAEEEQRAKEEEEKQQHRKELWQEEQQKMVNFIGKYVRDYGALPWNDEKFPKEQQRDGMTDEKTAYSGFNQMNLSLKAMEGHCDRQYWVNRDYIQEKDGYVRRGVHASKVFSFDESGKIDMKTIFNIDQTGSVSFKMPEQPEKPELSESWEMEEPASIRDEIVCDMAMAFLRQKYSNISDESGLDPKAAAAYIKEHPEEMAEICNEAAALPDKLREQQRRKEEEQQRQQQRLPEEPKKELEKPKVQKKEKNRGMER